MMTEENDSNIREDVEAFLETSTLILNQLIESSANALPEGDLSRRYLHGHALALEMFTGTAIRIGRGEEPSSALLHTLVDYGIGRSPYAFPLVAAASVQPLVHSLSQSMERTHAREQEFFNSLPVHLRLFASALGATEGTVDADNRSMMLAWDAFCTFSRYALDQIHTGIDRVRESIDRSSSGSQAGSSSAPQSENSPQNVESLHPLFNPGRQQAGGSHGGNFDVYERLNSEWHNRLIFTEVQASIGNMRALVSASSEQGQAIIQNLRNSLDEFSTGLVQNSRASSESRLRLLENLRVAHRQDFFSEQQAIVQRNLDEAINIPERPLDLNEGNRSTDLLERDEDELPREVQREPERFSVRIRPRPTSVSNSASPRVEVSGGSAPGGYAFRLSVTFGNAGYSPPSYRNNFGNNSHGSRSWGRR